jgi:hypothetical protein
VKWSEARALITGKLQGRIAPGRKHDKGYVVCDGRYVGRPVRLGHHVDMKPWELRGCAKSLLLTEAEFKALQRCDMSRDEFCRKALRAP